MGESSRIEAVEIVKDKTDRDIWRVERQNEAEIVGREAKRWVLERLERERHIAVTEQLLKES